LTLKRKQLSFTEVEMGIIVDALRNQWWMRYNPQTEKNVEIHHSLLDRIINAQAQLTNETNTTSDS